MERLLAVVLTLIGVVVSSDEHFSQRVALPSMNDFHDFGHRPSDAYPFPTETKTCCEKSPWMPRKLTKLDGLLFDIDTKNSDVYKRLSAIVEELHNFIEIQVKVDQYIVGTKVEIFQNGIKGQKGYRGVRGETGIPGDIGAKGIVGRPGHPGSRGSIGEPGEPGHPGGRGPKGFQGAQGKHGPMGSCVEYEVGGDRVKRQIQSPVGPCDLSQHKGDKGPKGPPGPPGSRGLPGMKGIYGPPGYVGRAGPKGVRGADCCMPRHPKPHHQYEEEDEDKTEFAAPEYPPEEHHN